MNGHDFHGAKIALICGPDLIVYRRDRKAGIPYPGMWDLPGGGREGSETAQECVCREVIEEFGIAIDPASFIWTRRYPSSVATGSASYFIVAAITSAEVSAVIFGEEGERWEMMAIDTFLNHPEAVASLQARLADFLSENPNYRFAAN